MEFVQQQAKEDPTNDTTTPPVAAIVDNAPLVTTTEGQDSIAAAPSNNVNALPSEPAPVPVAAAPVATVDPNKVAETIEKLTIYGNKSLEELHEIQSRRSHLSAGRFLSLLLCFLIFRFLVFALTLSFCSTFNYRSYFHPVLNHS